MTTGPMQVDDLLREAEQSIQEAPSLQELEQCRVRYLGKKGALTDLLKMLGGLPPEERKAQGQRLNTAKESLLAWIDAREACLTQQALTHQLTQESLDVTLPGRREASGSLHPLSQTMHQLRRIFGDLGFTCLQGPEIEDDAHNFTKLNIPPHHPARAMHDTFYFANGLLLRTHTSTVQIRAMKHQKPPFRMMAMGRVYRRDFDLTHTPMFHQLECLVIDETVNLTDLKGLLLHVLQAFFERPVTMRFRATYFPFTEPSLEVDMACLNCKGKGCRICKQSGYVEVLGCGMVHPAVLKMAKIDTKRFRGFAIGMGLDRLTLLKYGVTDLRLLFENDIRFLEQF